MREVNLSTLLSKLPYTLTDAQIKAVRDISDDFTGKKHPGKNLVPHMRRLLQGDVGSGKTAVAANEILANFGLNIRIAGTNNYMSGSGAVAIAQSHPAGSQVERGTVITVTFRNQDADDIPLES